MTLFPYTTLFRSVGLKSEQIWPRMSTMEEEQGARRRSSRGVHGQPPQETPWMVSVLSFSRSIIYWLSCFNLCCSVFMIGDLSPFVFIYSTYSKGFCVIDSSFHSFLFLYNLFHFVSNCWYFLLVCSCFLFDFPVIFVNVNLLVVVQ